jgi:hypothetical protein
MKEELPASVWSRRASTVNILLGVSITTAAAMFATAFPRLL